MFQPTKEWVNKVNLSSFELENFFKFGACVISARKAKQLDATTMFTYSHANTALGQSERAYYLSYFINFDRINQVFPDMMNLLKNVLSEFHFLFTGSGDSKKVRMTEKELGRFPDSWLDQQADEQPAEREPSGNSCIHL